MSTIHQLEELEEKDGQLVQTLIENILKAQKTVLLGTADVFIYYAYNSNVHNIYNISNYFKGHKQLMENTETLESDNKRYPLYLGTVSTMVLLSIP